VIDPANLFFSQPYHHLNEPDSAYVEPRRGALRGVDLACPIVRDSKGWQT